MNGFRKILIVVICSLSVFLIVVICSLSVYLRDENENITSLAEKGWLPQWISESGRLDDFSIDLDHNIFYCRIFYDENTYEKQKDVIREKNSKLDLNQRKHIAGTYFKQDDDFYLVDGTLFKCDDNKKIIEISVSTNSQGESRYLQSVRSSNRFGGDSQ